MSSDLAEPVWNEPALRLRLVQEGTPRTYLVAGELHLGLESQLARHGAYLRSRSRDLAERLLRLVERVHATRLVLLGDVKHRVTHLSPQERRDLPAFFERLAGLDAVHVALGNHDAGLRGIVPTGRFTNLTYHPAAGFLLKGDDTSVGCLHGHAWPRPGLLAADLLLVGHTHAAFALVDEAGRSTTEWAWVRGPIRPDAARTKYGRSSSARVIVFPPFNPLCAGVPVNREGLLGPFAKLLDLEAAEVHLLDGRALGRLGAPTKD